mmetsp:Transcript_23140/g.58743  ORF Transcript_23140/g.58743 Transcript_23140/m.58743 type:complete len:309 (-) Transcript_23140:327-1253(-)
MCCTTSATHSELSESIATVAPPAKHRADSPGSPSSPPTSSARILIGCQDSEESFSASASSSRSRLARAAGRSFSSLRAVAKGPAHPPPPLSDGTPPSSAPSPGSADCPPIVNARPPCSLPRPAPGAFDGPAWPAAALPPLPPLPPPSTPGALVCIATASAAAEAPASRTAASSSSTLGCAGAARALPLRAAPTSPSLGRGACPPIVNARPPALPPPAAPASLAPGAVQLREAWSRPSAVGSAVESAAGEVEARTSDGRRHASRPSSKRTLNRTATTPPDMAAPSASAPPAPASAPAPPAPASAAEASA